MSKGKFAARAANREVARDNELLAEKVAELAQARAEIAELKAALAVERRDRSSEVVRRAEELSEQQIQKVRAEISELKERQKMFNREIADLLAETLSKLEKSLVEIYGAEILPITDMLHSRGHIPDVFHRLVPDEWGSYEARMWIELGKPVTRRSRRPGFKKSWTAP